MVDHRPIIREKLLSVSFQKQHTTDGLVTRKSFLLRLRVVCLGGTFLTNQFLAKIYYHRLC